LFIELSQSVWLSSETAALQHAEVAAMNLSFIGGPQRRLVEHRTKAAP